VPDNRLGHHIPGNLVQRDTSISLAYREFPLLKCRNSNTSLIERDILARFLFTQLRQWQNAHCRD
jgi:hypothetical protein